MFISKCRSHDFWRCINLYVSMYENRQQKAFDLGDLILTTQLCPGGGQGANDRMSTQRTLQYRSVYLLPSICSSVTRMRGSAIRSVRSQC